MAFFWPQVLFIFSRARERIAAPYRKWATSLMLWAWIKILSLFCCVPTELHTSKRTLLWKSPFFRLAAPPLPCSSELHWLPISTLLGSNYSNARGLSCVVLKKAKAHVGCFCRLWSTTKLKTKQWCLFDLWLWALQAHWQGETLKSVRYTCYWPYNFLREPEIDQEAHGESLFPCSKKWPPFF